MTWEPLCAEQPVEGDPAVVREYGRDLERTAALIAAQADALRSLADPQEWRADTADAFRDQAGDLEQEISKAHGRFQRVGGHVVAWADMIDEARRRAEVLRSDAQTQQRVLDTTTEAQPQLDPADPAQPAALTDQGREVNGRRRRAEEAIDDLRDDLSALLDEHRGYGEEYGRLIRAAQDDGLNDGFWDRVRAWIAHHAPLLRDIATWAGRIAAVVGLVALMFTPLGWVAAAAALVAVLASGALLVSGDGSWGSFALNVVGLLTFGVGAAATRGVTTAFRAGRVVRAAPAISAARSGVLNAADSTVVQVLSRLPLVGGPVGGVARGVQTVARVPAATRAATAVERAAVRAPLQPTTVVQRTLFGGRVPAAARAEARAWINEGTAAVQAERIISGTSRYLGATGSGAGLNVLLIVEDVALPGLPPHDEYASTGR